MEGLGTSTNKTLHALELLSCFDAWTWLDNYWKLTQQEQFSSSAKDSIAKLLRMLRDSLPCTDRNGWKLSTVHNTMHIVGDMCKYGKPKEPNTEVGEKNHKVFAKSINCHCQKHHKTFAQQVLQCLTDAFVIDKVASAMGLLKIDEKESNSNTDVITDDGIVQDTMKGATHYMLELNSKNKLSATWNSVMESHLLSCKSNLCNFLQSYFLSSVDNFPINCCTEYTYGYHLFRYPKVGM